MFAPTDLTINFLQHGALFESSSQGNIASSIWIATIWTLWKARN